MTAHSKDASRIEELKEIFALFLEVLLPGAFVILVFGARVVTKSADTAVSAETVIWQMAASPQPAPEKPAKPFPFLALAVSVTSSPGAKLSTQSVLPLPQAIPVALTDP